MWTCPKCNTQVEPPFTVCRNCGTAAEDAASSTAIQTNGAGPVLAPASAPPPLQAVVPPPKQETFMDRAIAGALAGALCGALYGSVFSVVIWMILTSFGIQKQETWLTEFPSRLFVTAGIFAAVLAVLGALLRQITGRKRPPREPSPK